MAQKLLTKEEARELAEQAVKSKDKYVTTQEVLDSGAVPRLEGCRIRPGKVSDSIFGGKGSYEDKATGKTIEFENPPLCADDGTPLRLMVRTTRISTHDKNRGDIPFKDQIVAMNHNHMRKMVRETIGTSQLDVPGLEDNAVVIGAEDLTQVLFENVLREYMAKSSTSTSLYMHFMKGERKFCGHKLPKDLIPNGRLPYMMDTPSTKSDDHDISVTPAELVKMGVCTRREYNQIIGSSIVAFGDVANFGEEKGLILVDTKTEHGKNKDGEIVSQDELYTLDSSRWWLLDDYNKQLEFIKAGDEKGLVAYLKETQPGIKEKDYVVDGKVILCPRSYSKEFARGFSVGDKLYTDDQRVEIAARYIEAIQHLLGKRFEPDMRSREERVVTGLQTVVDELVRH
ncbi:phosphoribosylaminoimidazolesuccinocarboxamide synthase [Nanoarchaeota archaeon]